MCFTGHLRLLKFAQSLGDKLIVAVQSQDSSPKDSIVAVERLNKIQLIPYVDEAFIMIEDVDHYLNKLKPDIVVKGWEFRDEDNIEENALNVYGGKLIFSPDSSTSTGFSDFLNPSPSRFGAINLPVNFLSRRQINPEQIYGVIKDFQKLKVCVLGDIIVDDYINCSAVGMSREDPTIVVKPETSSLFLGGAGIVASHARALGANVSLISVVGDDDLKGFVQEQLSNASLDCHLLIDDTRPTTKKTRYRVEGKTQLRVNDYNSHSISTELQNKILSIVSTKIRDLDLIVFSDFNYGALPASLVTKIIDLCKKQDLLMVADSQTSSQLGDLAKFEGVSLVTPTEHEARVTLGDFESGLVTLSNKLRYRLKIKNVILTLSSDGILITCSEDEKLGDDFQNDRLPAFQSSIVDASGAGDAFFISSSLSMAAGGSLWLSSYIGSIVAAIQVAREGNIPISAENIKEALSNWDPHLSA